MSFYDHVIYTLYDLKDSAIGSGIYFMYGYFFKKTDFWKGFIAFIIGTITAQYLSPEVLKLLPSFSLSFISFICGLLGMRIAQFIMEHEGWKKAIDKIFNVN